MSQQLSDVAPAARISSPYLEEIETNIRVRPIPWEGYARANLLSESEASLIKEIEKPSMENKKKTVEGKAESYATVIIGLLNRITRDDVVKYLLSLVGDFAPDCPNFVSELLKEDDNKSSVTYEVLAKFLNKNDEQIHLLASRALVLLIRVKPAPHDTVIGLFSYLSSKLISSQNINLQDIAVQGLGILLEPKWYRGWFWELNAQLIPPLLKLVTKKHLPGSNGAVATTTGSSGSAGIQFQYHTILIFWVITFEKVPSLQLVTHYSLVPILLDISKVSVKEKIVRVSIATLVNLVKHAHKSAVAALLSNSAANLIKTLSERKWTDEELIADLQYLNETLQGAFTSMTTFDEYNSELVSKKLEWTPPHRSETFWKENINKFKETDWKVTKEVSAILQTSTDPTTLAVACNDLTWIINELSESVKILEKLGAKLKVMQLMNSSDPDIRYEALKATQAFIAHSFN